MMANKKSKKIGIISCLTAFTFFISQMSYAFPQIGIEISSPVETPSNFQFSIPADIASIDDIYEAPAQPNPRVIFHIQNSHANYSAQLKIKQLLAYLNKTYSIKTVFVEGASEDLHTDYLKMFPDREHNMRLAQFLAEQGELTGAEMYLLEAETDHGSQTIDNRSKKDSKLQSSASGIRSNGFAVKAHGIEDAALYRENYEALRKVFGAATTVNAYLASYEMRLDSLASKVFSPDLRKLLAEWKKFEKGHREFMPYVRNLSVEVKRILGIDLESLFAQVEWPQITRLLVLQTLERELDVRKGLEERDALVLFLNEKKASRKLIESVRNFRDQRMSVFQGRAAQKACPIRPRDLMEQLEIEVGSRGFRFSDYPNFSLYAGYVILESELDAKGLFAEIRSLFGRIFDALAGTAREKKLLELYRDEEVVRKLLNLELARKDWQVALSRGSLLSMDSMVKRLNEIRTAIDGGAEEQHTGLKMQKVNSQFRSEVMATQDAAYSFYKAARKREEVFYKKIDSVMQEGAITKAVLITGGFHTDGVTELLREHEVSYGVLTPNIDQKSDGNLYRSIMMMDRSYPFEISNLEAILRLQPWFAAERQGMVSRGFLEPVLHGIMKAAGVRFEVAVEIFNQCHYAKDAKIRIDPQPILKKRGRPVYQVSRRVEIRSEQREEQEVATGVHLRNIHGSGIDMSNLVGVGETTRSETRGETPEVRGKNVEGTQSVISRGRRVALAASVSLISIFLRFYGMDYRGPWMDEATYINAGRMFDHPLRDWGWINGWKYGYPMLAAFSDWLFSSFIGARYLNALFGTGILALSYLQSRIAIRRLMPEAGSSLNEKRGLLGAMALAVALPLILISRLATYDAMAYFFFTLSFYLVDLASTKEKNRSYYVASAVALALAVITKYVVVLFLPFLTAYALSHMKNWKVWARDFLVPLGVLLGVFVCFFWKDVVFGISGVSTGALVNRPWMGVIKEIVTYVFPYLVLGGIGFLNALKGKKMQAFWYAGGGFMLIAYHIVAGHIQGVHKSLSLVVIIMAPLIGIGFQSILSIRIHAKRWIQCWVMFVAMAGFFVLPQYPQRWKIVFWGDTYVPNQMIQMLASQMDHPKIFTTRPMELVYFAPELEPYTNVTEDPSFAPAHMKSYLSGMYAVPQSEYLPKMESGLYDIVHLERVYWDSNPDVGNLPHLITNALKRGGYVEALYDITPQKTRWGVSKVPSKSKIYVRSKEEGAVPSFSRSRIRALAEEYGLTKPNPHAWSYEEGDISWHVDHPMLEGVLRKEFEAKKIVRELALKTGFDLRGTSGAIDSQGLGVWVGKLASGEMTPAQMEEEFRRLSAAHGVDVPRSETRSEVRTEHRAQETVAVSGLRARVVDFLNRVFDSAKIRRWIFFGGALSIIGSIMTLSALSVNWQSSSVIAGVFYVATTGFIFINGAESIVGTLFSFLFMALKGSMEYKEELMPHGIPDSHKTLLAYMLVSGNPAISREAMKNMADSYLNNLDPNGNITAVLVSASTKLSVVKAEMDLRDHFRGVIRTTLREEASQLLSFKGEDRWHSFENHPRFVFWKELFERWENRELGGEAWDAALDAKIERAAEQFKYLHRTTRSLKKAGQYQDLFVLASRGIEMPYAYTDERYGKYRRDANLRVFGFERQQNIENDLGLSVEAESVLLRDLETRGRTDVEDLKQFGLKYNSKEDRNYFKYTVVCDQDNKVPTGGVRKLVQIAAANPDRGVLQPAVMSDGSETWSQWRESLSSMWMKNLPDGFFWIFGRFGDYGKGLINNDLYVDRIIGTSEKPIEALQVDVLSHDTVEGVYLNPMYVSKVVIGEEWNRNYIAKCLQQGRWRAGDVQNLFYFVKPLQKILVSARKVYSVLTRSENQAPWIRPNDFKPSRIALYIAHFPSRTIITLPVFTLWLFINPIVAHLGWLTLQYPLLQLVSFLIAFKTLAVMPKMYSPTMDFLGGVKELRQRDWPAAKLKFEAMGLKMMAGMLEIVLAPFNYMPEVLISNVFLFRAVKTVITGKAVWGKSQSEVGNELTYLPMRTILRHEWYVPVAAFLALGLSTAAGISLHFLTLILLGTWIVEPITTWLGGREISATARKTLLYRLVEVRRKGNGAPRSEVRARVPVVIEVRRGHEDRTNGRDRQSLPKVKAVILNHNSAVLIKKLMKTLSVMPGYVLKLFLESTWGNKIVTSAVSAIRGLYHGLSERHPPYHRSREIQGQDLSLASNKIPGAIIGPENTGVSLLPSESENPGFGPMLASNQKDGFVGLTGAQEERSERSYAARSEIRGTFASGSSFDMFEDARDVAMEQALAVFVGSSAAFFDRAKFAAELKENGFPDSIIMQDVEMLTKTHFQDLAGTRGLDLMTEDVAVKVAGIVRGIMEIEDPRAAALQMHILAIAIGTKAMVSVIETFNAAFSEQRLPTSDDRGYVYELVQSLPAAKDMSEWIAMAEAMLTLNPKLEYRMVALVDKAMAADFGIALASALKAWDEKYGTALTARFKVISVERATVKRNPGSLFTDARGRNYVLTVRQDLLALFPDLEMKLAKGSVVEEAYSDVAENRIAHHFNMVRLSQAVHGLETGAVLIGEEIQKMGFEFDESTRKIRATDDSLRNYLKDVWQSFQGFLKIAQAA